MKISILQITICFLIVLQGCVSVQRNRFSNDLFPELKSDDIVAVSTIYDALNGDITNLGNRWRGKIENILAQRGITVKARKDIIFLIDEAETFENGVDENKIWQEAGADIIIRGAYTILSPSYDENNIKRTVSLLYPNKYMKNKPLSSKYFRFPPLKGEINQLELYPLEHGKICRESFKIIASKEKLDFSFLPFPEGIIYAGAKGGDINKMIKLLKQHTGFNEALLTYWVGRECK